MKNFHLGSNGFKMDLKLQLETFMSNCSSILLGLDTCLKSIVAQSYSIYNIYANFSRVPLKFSLKSIFAPLNYLETIPASCAEVESKP